MLEQGAHGFQVVLALLKADGMTGAGLLCESRLAFCADFIPIFPNSSREQRLNASMGPKLGTASEKVLNLERRGL